MNSGAGSVKFMLFGFDARSSSADIKGTVVGMVSSPWSASVLVEVAALLVFVTPEHTLFVLTVV